MNTDSRDFGSETGQNLVKGRGVKDESTKSHSNILGLYTRTVANHPAKGRTHFLQRMHMDNLKPHECQSTKLGSPTNATLNSCDQLRLLATAPVLLTKAQCMERPS